VDENSRLPLLHSGFDCAPDTENTVDTLQIGRTSRASNPICGVSTVFSAARGANRVRSISPSALRGKGATTGESGGPDPPKFGRTTPTFLTKRVITVT